MRPLSKVEIRIVVCLSHTLTLTLPRNLDHGLLDSPLLYGYQFLFFGNVFLVCYGYKGILFGIEGSLEQNLCIS